MYWMAIVISVVTAGEQLAEPSAALRLENARLEVVTQSGDSKAWFEATVVNDMDVSVNALDIGVVITKNEDLLGADALAGVYSGQQVPGVQYLRFDPGIAVDARSSVLLRKSFDLGLTQNQRSFVHLLGYRPEIVSRELLDRLLKSRLAADEMAVAQSLGLYFHHKSWRKKSLEQAEAQSQFEIWKKAMEGEWSLKPSLVDLKRLCVAALGLHLNGSTEALELIEKAGKRDGIQRFDEPLQLIRTARLASSPLESPLAFLIPAEAATMAAVLEELTSGEMRFRATVVESLAPVREPQPQPQPKRAPVSQVWGWWCAIALGLVGLFCYRRYSKR